jgi:creatinine amidohydrolase
MTTHRWIPTLGVVALAALAGWVQAAPARAAAVPAKPVVRIDYMTWPEIYDAIHKEGKTTVLIFDGGTEQRGPQCVLGGHTLVAESTATLIAEKLGNALVAPVLPISPTGVSEDHPGGVTMSPELFKAVNAAMVDSMVKNGFKNIVLMGDHGGGQKELGEVAKEKNMQYSSQGVHVLFCSDNYTKAKKQFDDYLTAHHLPQSSHGGIADTSELMYLGGAKYVRTDKITFGDPLPGPGEKPAQKINNGITGDARGSSAALGKVQVDMKVDAAVRQIRGLIAGTSSTAPH